MCSNQESISGTIMATNSQTYDRTLFQSFRFSESPLLATLSLAPSQLLAISYLTPSSALVEIVWNKEFINMRTSSRFIIGLQFSHLEMNT